MRGTSAFAGAVIIAFGLIFVCEWRTDEDTITLALVMASALVCGALKPRLFWAAGLSLGSAVAAADLAMALSGVLPRYLAKPPTVVSALGLAVLVIPALVAAAIGGGLARAIRRRE